MQRQHFVADYGAAGAIVGFVLALLEFVGLLWLSFRVERHAGTETASVTAWLLRLTALLGLALSTGIGYLIGRAFGG